MRKGFFASVAALAAGTGVALGQGWPAGPAGSAPGAPGWPGAGPVPIAAAGAAGGAQPPSMLPPGGYPGGALPQATEMPSFGRVDGPGMHDQGPPPGFEPGLPPTGGFGSPQLHRAAGGPDLCYLNIEQLVWYPTSQAINYPLLTTGPLPPLGVGRLGDDGTRVLFGNENIDYKYFNVLRLTGGVWDTPRRWGLEASGFIQEGNGEYFDIVQPQTQTVVVGGRQVIARPVVDAFTGAQQSILVASPGVFGGEAHIQARLKMGGAEASLLRSIVYCDTFKLNLLAGVRYIDHDENLQTITRSVIPAAAQTDTVVIDVFDEFATRNQFFGGQVGFQSEFRRGRCFMDVTGKVGVGNMNQQLNVNGFTHIVDPVGNVVLPGGLLAVATNSGKVSRDQLAYVPELTLTLGYQITQRVSTYFGYNVLYMTNVLRPGEQIDPVVNPTFIPLSNNFGTDSGPTRPVNTFKESDFWTQGLTFGLSIRY